MDRGKTLAFLLVVTIAVVTGAYLTQQGSDSIPMSGKPLVAGLLDDMDRVEVIKVSGRGKSFSVQRKEGRWVVPDRHDYIASAQKVHQLLVGLAQTTRIEPKTSKPDLYAKVGLGDPLATGEDSGMVRFVLEDNNEQVMASVTIGQEGPARGDPNQSEYFVLKGDDPQVWLVEGKIPLDNLVGDWVDNEVMGIEPARVAKVTVEHPPIEAGGEVVVVTRDDPANTDFTLVDQPPGSELVQKWQVDDIGRGLARLNFENVTQGSLDDVEGEPGIRVTMTTHDGMRVVMTTKTAARPEPAEGATAGDAPLIFGTLLASFDETLVNQALQDEKKAGDSVDLTTLDRDARSKAEAHAKIQDPAAVREEVKAANVTWADWVYEIEDFKARHLLRKMVDLIKPQEVTEQAPEQGPALAPEPTNLEQPGTAPESAATDSTASDSPPSESSLPPTPQPAAATN